MSSNSLFIKSPVDKNDQCVRQFFFSLNIKLATWQQMCDSVSSYSIYTRRRIFFGKITAVVLNKTCDSLKAIKSSVQSETVVYYCANPDIVMALQGLFISLGNMSHKLMETR